MREPSVPASLDARVTSSVSATPSVPASSVPAISSAPALAAASARPTPADAVIPSGDCSGAEVFALRVIGHSMAPEFEEGEIIVVEPDGAVRDGSYVLAQLDREWTFRQLRMRETGWWLEPLNPAFPPCPVPDLSVVRGVIIQKARPGRRRASKSYL